jgi:hypothetical protein
LIKERVKTADIVQNALNLGVEQFMLREQKNKFWNLVNKT